MITKSSCVVALNTVTRPGFVPTQNHLFSKQALNVCVCVLVFFPCRHTPPPQRGPGCEPGKAVL